MTDVDYISHDDTAHLFFQKKKIFIIYKLRRSTDGGDGKFVD